MSNQMKNDLQFIDLVKNEIVTNSKYLELLRDLKHDMASDINTSSEVLAILAKDNSSFNFFIKRAIIENPNCTSEILEELANNESWGIKQYIARSPKCTNELLERLANNEVREVRMGVASNPICPKEILEKLTNNEHCHIKVCVAGNPNCPIEVLEKLIDEAKHEEIFVGTSFEYFEDYKIREIVKDNLNCIDELKMKILDITLDELSQTSFIEDYDIVSFRQGDLDESLKSLLSIASQNKFEPLEQKIELE